MKVYASKDWVEEKILEAQSDWNASEGEAGHVLNRTHYEEERCLVEEIQVTTDANGLGEFTPLFDISEDKEYMVFIDGVSYAGVAVDVSESGSVLGIVVEEIELVIANNEFNGGDGTAMFFGMTAAVSTTVTLSIYEKNIVKIPAKYLYTPDWNQSDETAADFIKNKTHYDHSVYYVQWTSEDIEKISRHWYKVSDNTIEYEDLIGCQIYSTSTNEVLFEITADTAIDKTNYIQIYTDYYLDMPLANIVLKDGGFSLDVTPLNKGIYFYSPLDFDTLPDTKYSNACYIGKYDLRQLDEKYIPNSIARISELPQSDWNQTDETQSDYIKNKPDFDSLELITIEDIDAICGASIVSASNTTF